MRERSDRVRWVAWAGGVALLVAVGVMWASSQGVDTGPGPVVGLTAVAAALALDAWPVLLWLAAAWGWGALLAPIWRGAREEQALRWGAGVAVMLTLAFLLGAFGLGRAGAWAPVVAGCLAALRALGRNADGAGAPSWAWLLGAPTLGVLLAASVSGPGWLWDSEFGGYDALSYHLRLVQEWLADGRVRTYEHNVYSFLPGFVGAAFHQVALMGGASGPGAGDRVWGIVAEGGRLLTTAQMLHGAMAVLGAWMVARAARAALSRCGFEGARLGPALAGVVVLATPWVVVVGSLAYNEMAVVLLGAAAVVAALEHGLSPRVRGVLVGALVGVACGAKPTAILFVAPLAGALLIGMEEPRRAARALGWCCLAGLVALLPWLARNAIETGNPVFPQAGGLLGIGHWSEEQAQRWAAGHRAEGHLLDRAMLLVMRDGAGRSRGLSHIQWGAAAFILLWCAGSALAQRPTRRVALWTTLGVLGLLGAWVAFTHAQSRFLLPIVVPMGVLLGLATGVGVAAGGARAAASVAGAVLAVVAQSAALVWTWTGQRQGEPAAAMVGFAGVMSGELLPEEARGGGPWSALNHAPGVAGEPVLLVGDAAVLYACGPIVYHTTWDRSPLGDAMREHPGDPAAWSDALRAQGVALVMVNPGELDRLHASGWYDPEVTTERVMAWLEGEADLLSAWPGRSLWRLR